jgi:hypothetical protein
MANDIFAKEIVHNINGLEEVNIKSNIVYSKAESGPLLMDVYTPKGLSKEEIIMLYNDDIAYLNNSDFKGKKLKLFTIDQITKKYKEQGEFLYLVLKDVEIKPFSISITLENIDSGGKAFVGGYTEIRYTILFGKIVKSKIEGNFIY